MWLDRLSFPVRIGLRWISASRCSEEIPEEDQERELEHHLDCLDCDTRPGLRTEAERDVVRQGETDETAACVAGLKR